MALIAGAKLGPYEIIATLGAGGMGEVYRARDSRLGREVAIKVLPKSLTADADHLRRFEQEARAASALNHPNILAVYDIGVDDGTPYLVTELLEGVTLRDRLHDGPTPSRKAIEYAIQIAQGLAAAHDKGIVHRDLKPENIFICRDGRAKILDFGLAKLIAAEPSDATRTTLELDYQTEAGVVMGTAGYMSPEQLRGQKADQRSDIFSFGSVLYEMLSGQRAFGGQTAADRSSAILKEDPPDLLTLGRNIPAPVERIVRHCLEKDPGHRFQSARDLAFNLESSLSASDSGIAKSEIPAGYGKESLRWLATLAALVLVAGASWWLRGKDEPGPRTVKFLRLTDYVGLEESPAFSPDGKSVAFVSDSSESRQIWIRLLAGGRPLQITNGPGQHLEPRWSQDSASLLYFSSPANGGTQGSLWEVSALGGPPRQVVPSISGADVSHDGKRLAFFRLNGQQTELVLTDRDGGSVRVIMSVTTSYGFRFPRWSPDDSRIAYIHSRENWSDDVYVVGADGGNPRRLTVESTLMSGVAWTPDGSKLVYSSARGSTLLYLPTMHLWEVSRRGGEPQQLTFGDIGDESPDVNREGHVVVSRIHMEFNIWKFPVSGDPVANVRNGSRVTQQTGLVQTPSVDPTDKEIVYLSDSGGHVNLWVQSLEGGDARQITFERNPNTVVGVPIWSPTGSLITFATARLTSDGRGVGYWLVQPDGSNLRLAIPLATWATWSGDGKWLYYTDLGPVFMIGSRILKVPVSGGTPIVVRTDNGRGPAVAPDGSALYYIVPIQNPNGSMDFELRVARPENGPSELMARFSEDRVPLWQGLHPVVSRDGKWLAIPLNDNKGTNIWAVSTADGKLRQLTDFGERRTFIARRVSWSSDGKWVFASVGEGDSDIVQMDGLLQ